MRSILPLMIAAGRLQAEVSGTSLWAQAGRDSSSRATYAKRRSGRYEPQPQVATKTHIAVSIRLNPRDLFLHWNFTPIYRV